MSCARLIGDVVPPQRQAQRLGIHPCGRLEAVEATAGEKKRLVLPHTGPHRAQLAAETEPLAAVLEMEAVHQARTAMTEDHLEASRAFAEKRRPVFKGR